MWFWPQVPFKGCVRYIFATLFCMSKREHLWQKQKLFLFHFDSSFRSWDNQLLTFQISECHDVIKCLVVKHETHINAYLGNWTQSGNEIWPVYINYKIKFLIKKLYEKCGLETSSMPFFIFKEFSVKRVLRRSAGCFGQILIAFLLHIQCK